MLAKRNTPNFPLLLQQTAAGLLPSINIQNTPITDDWCVQFSGILLANNTALTQITFRYNGFGPVCGVALVKALDASTVITVFDLTGNTNLNATVWYALADVLRRNTILKALSTAATGMDPSAFSAIMQTLGNNTQATPNVLAAGEVICNSNTPCGTQIANATATYLSLPTASIRSISLYGDPFLTDDILTIIKSLYTNQHLYSLVLDFPLSTDGDAIAAALAKLFAARNGPLTVLDLQGFNITAAGLQQMYDAIRLYNRAITYVGLGNNPVLLDPSAAQLVANFTAVLNSNAACVAAPAACPIFPNAPTVNVSGYGPIFFNVTVTDVAGGVLSPVNVTIVLQNPVYIRLVNAQGVPVPNASAAGPLVQYVGNGTQVPSFSVQGFYQGAKTLSMPVRVSFTPPQNVSIVLGAPNATVANATQPINATVPTQQATSLSTAPTSTSQILTNASTPTQQPATSLSAAPTSTSQALTNASTPTQQPATSLSAAPTSTSQILTNASTPTQQPATSLSAAPTSTSQALTNASTPTQQPATSLSAAPTSTSQVLTNASTPTQQPATSLSTAPTSTSQVLTNASTPTQQPATSHPSSAPTSTAQAVTSSASQTSMSIPPTITTIINNTQAPTVTVQFAANASSTTSTTVRVNVTFSSPANANNATLAFNSTPTTSSGVVALAGNASNVTNATRTLVLNASNGGGLGASSSSFGAPIIVGIVAGGIVGILAVGAAVYGFFRSKAKGPAGTNTVQPTKSRTYVPAVKSNAISPYDIFLGENNIALNVFSGTGTENSVLYDNQPNTFSETGTENPALYDNQLNASNYGTASDPDQLNNDDYDAFLEPDNYAIPAAIEEAGYAVPVGYNPTYVPTQEVAVYDVGNSAGTTYAATGIPLGVSENSTRQSPVTYAVPANPTDDNALYALATQSQGESTADTVATYDNPTQVLRSDSGSDQSHSDHSDTPLLGTRASTVPKAFMASQALFAPPKVAATATTRQPNPNDGYLDISPHAETLSPS